MTYLITCSGSKITPEIYHPSTLEALSFNAQLNVARTNMINLYQNQTNHILDWNKTLPAWQLYSGNRAKLYPKVLPANWMNPETDVRILSALFGWIKHTDLILHYNLEMVENLAGIAVNTRWRNLGIMQNFYSPNDIDLLSINYRKAINANGNIIAIQPNIAWRDKYGNHKGEWLNNQL